MVKIMLDIKKFITNSVAKVTKAWHMKGGTIRGECVMI